MPPRGPKPKPTHLKVLEGNPGKRPLNPNEPRPAPVAPSPPATLSQVAREEWERIAPPLERLGLLTELDRAALGCYCEAYSRWVAASRVLAESPIVVTTRKGDRVSKNPAIQVQRDAALEMARWAAEFGMTPSARSRMTVPGHDESDLEELLA